MHFAALAALRPGTSRTPPAFGGGSDSTGLAMVSSLKDLQRQAAERDFKDTIQRLRRAEKELVALEKLRLATRREEVNRRKFLHRTYRLNAVREWLAQQ